MLAQEADVVIVLGSQNSSNSQRLRELAEEFGRRGYLIDLPEDLPKDWFHGAQTVLVTAGASAPESVVERFLQHLEDQFDAQIEVRNVREEQVHFPLPKELRSVAS